MFEPREYQADAMTRTYSYLEQGHRPIVCAACGAGKTVIAAHMAHDYIEAGKRVLWMTGREEILRQAFNTFNEICGAGKCGILMRDERPWWFYPAVSLASWDTLKSRWNKSDTWKIPADVLLVDEAHLSLSKVMSETIMEHYKGGIVVGFTATPARRSGRGLGSYYTKIIQVRAVQDIIDDGFLAPCEYWAGAHVDVSKIRTDAKTRDYQERELAHASMEGKLIGDVVDNWLRLAKDRHTIVFAVDIAHAQALAERFQSVGIAADTIHSRMAHGTRSEISDLFRRGELQVLVNVGIATYGYDVPSVNCVVLARPTKSIVLHHQMIGRGMRPKPDGGYCMVLDHADNVRRLGCVEDEIRWRLDSGKDAAVNTTREGDASRGKPAESPPTECGECRFVFSRSRVCPKCGWEKPAPSRDIETVDADLVRVRAAKGDSKTEAQDRQRWYLMGLGWAVRNRKQPGFVAHSYKERFGEWPPRQWRELQPMDPDQRVSNYLLSKVIRYAKSKRRD